MAREDAELRLAASRAELVELAAAGEGYEAQIEELTESLAARTSERDTLSGRLRELESEVISLKADVQREMSTSESLRLELAKGQLRVESADEKAKDAQARERTAHADLESAQGELARERRQHAEAMASERGARSDAERRAEVADARLEAERQAKGQADARIGELLKSVAGIEGVAARAASAEAAVTELRAQVTMLQGLLASASGGAAPKT